MSSLASCASASPARAASRPWVAGRPRTSSRLRAPGRIRRPTAYPGSAAGSRTTCWPRCPPARSLTAARPCLAGASPDGGAHEHAGQRVSWLAEAAARGPGPARSDHQHDRRRNRLPVQPRDHDQDPAAPGHDRRARRPSRGAALHRPAAPDDQAGSRARRGRPGAGETQRPTRRARGRKRPAACPRLTGGPDHAVRRPAADDRRALDQGMLEIAPVQAPLIVLVWGVQRVVPVVVGSLSITEEVFDPQLRPIRAKVSLELKVLTTSDLPITHLGSTLYLGYRRIAESLAALVAGTDVRPLGLEHLP